MKRIIFLLLVTVPFFLAGCASNPPSVAKVVQKEAPVAVSVPETKKEIIFPSQHVAIVVPVKNGDTKSAQTYALQILFSIMRQKCEWKKPLNHYLHKVEVKIMTDKDFLYAQTKIDQSLCPEKN